MRRIAIPCALILFLITSLLSGCTNEATVPLATEFSALSTEAKVGEVINFTDATTGGTSPYTYEWDFDDDAITDSTEANPSHMYSEPDTYSISLKVTDADGNIDTKTKGAYITIASEIKDLEAIARRFVELFSDGKFSETTELFNAEMNKALTSEALETMWEDLTSSEQFGSFKGIVSTTPIEISGYEAVIVTCEFSKSSVGIRTIFDHEAKIAGFQFVPPAEQEIQYQEPAYAKPESFTETECTVGTGNWQLPATLTLPKGIGAFPAVVLVHGSGPNDRDETIGPNRPFKDLAWGLATQGIAVLRYEKRTKQHPTKILDMIEDFTVNEETIEDALAAINMLGETEGIDPNRIFILGHSMGGMLAPRIASQSDEVDGLILLASNTKNLPDVILEQTSYIFSLDGEISDDESKQLEEISNQVNKVKELDIDEGAIVLGASRAYWADLMAYDPVKTASELTLPMLILQGERDYQVTMEDFDTWKESLAKQEGVSFKSYPNLNHLFIAGSDKSTPAEYSQSGNVAQAVINDIVGWIKS
ncbi:MAG: alpha/beta fold hydrolase [Dehalococcoidia bacterium]|nr:alpha/beta fold hydrolase [Dehalococcoidia bacterium]